MQLKRLSFLILVLLFGPLLAERQAVGDAAKQPAKVEDLNLAEKHWNDGRELFAQGKYELAKIEFWASYELSHRPDLLHNLSIVAEKLDRIPEAIELEERYLKELPSSDPLPPEERAAIETRLIRLRGLVQSPQKAAPASLPATSPAPFTQAPSKAPPRGSIALMGTGGGLLLVGLGCGLGAILTANTINSGMAGSNRAALIQRGQALNASAIVFDVLGGSLLAGGAIWAIVHRVKGPKR